MINYTTKEKVIAYFRDLVIDEANSALTTDKIEYFIEQAEAIINGRLAQFYNTPLTGDLSILILGKITELMAAGTIDDILNNYVEGAIKPNYHKQAEELLLKYLPKYNDKKCEWCNPEAKFPDDVFLGLPITTPKISVQETVTPPQFKKGVDKW